MNLHPQFEQTPKEFRWTGKLRPLFDQLNKEARAVPGKTKWRCLPSGALVSMKYRGDGSREMKIIRTEAPKDPEKGPDRFRREVDTFVRDFAIAHWTRGPHPAKEGVGIGAILVEPHPQAGHMVVCGWKDGCTELVTHNPTFDVNHCSAHMFECGRETAAEVRARIEREQQDLIPHGMP